jgi:hypothetical protein
MNQTKKIVSIFAVVLLMLMSATCKKDKTNENSNTGNTVINNDPVPNNSVPNILLTGTPAQNLVTVFEAGISNLEANMDNPANAAKGLESIMTTHNMTELRGKSKAEKEAGRGASEAEKKRLRDGMEKYKELAVKIGSKDPAAFNPAHTKWSAAWGIK